jgi:hypothetical protein
MAEHERATHMHRLAIGTVGIALLAALMGPAAAFARDRDHDGLPDRWEKLHHLSVHHKSAAGDPDRDKVDNRNELRERTDPRDRDTDNDGIPDGREDPDRDRLRNAGEDATGNDPRDPDTDDDGVRDGAEQAGVIDSFDGGTLTIRLAAGGTISGAVTDATEVECESEHQAEDAEHGRLHASAADEPGDDQDEPGDDEGDDGDHQGEDTGDGGDHGDDGESDGGEHACSADDLQVGVPVHEAELDVTAGGAVFKKVQLIAG